MTAQQYLDQYKDALVLISKKDGGKICGFIREVEGSLLSAGALVPNSHFLKVETVGDVPAYLRNTGWFEYGHAQIAEDNIDKVEVVRLP